MKETTLTTNPPKKAGQKPATTKPTLNQFWAIWEANQKVKALITSMNRPIVRTTQPQDKNVSKGRMKALTETST